MYLKRDSTAFSGLACCAGEAFAGWRSQSKPCNDAALQSAGQLPNSHTGSVKRFCWRTQQHRSGTGAAPGGELSLGGQQASRVELCHHTHAVAVVHGRSPLQHRPHAVGRVQLQDLLGEDLLAACGREEGERRSVWLRKGKGI